MIEIKRHSLHLDRGEEHEMLQIIDVSKDWLLDKQKGESNLMSLLNATVSHEMRNPLNSIYAQNIRLG